jgi:hypothetical protein
MKRATWLNRTGVLAISKSRFSGVKIDWIDAQRRTVGGCLIG